MKWKASRLRESKPGSSELPVLQSKDLVNGLTSISDGSRTWLCVELQYESGYIEQQYIHTLVYRIWCMNGECKWVWLCNITNTPHHEPQHFGLCIGACSVEKSTVTHDTHLYFSYGSMIDYSYVIKNYNVHWYNYTSGWQWTLVCNTTEVVIAYSICVYSDGGTVHVHQNSVLQTLHVKHEITWNNTVCLLSRWWVRLISSVLQMSIYTWGRLDLLSLPVISRLRGVERGSRPLAPMPPALCRKSRWGTDSIAWCGERVITAVFKYQLLLPLHLYLLLTTVHKNGQLE